MILSTFAPSSIVDRSPGDFSSHRARSTLRITFPERVLGSLGDDVQDPQRRDRADLVPDGGHALLLQDGAPPCPFSPDERCDVLTLPSLLPSDHGRLGALRAERLPPAAGVEEPLASALRTGRRWAIRCASSLRPLS